MANGDMSDFVSQREFDRTLRLLEEVRQDIKRDVAALSGQLQDTKEAITERQDEANGRTSKNEVAVAAVTKQLEAVVTQVSVVQKTVSSIQMAGCNEKRRHAEMLATMAAAGIVPDTGDLVEGAATSWHKPAKQAGIAGGLVGLGALAPHIWGWLHDLAHLIAGVK